jgi:hypothetical protein
LLAFDRPLNLPPRFVVPLELAQGTGDVVADKAFVPQISLLHINICRLPIKGHGLFGAIQGVFVETAKLIQTTRLPS